jgi:putative membrane protein
VAEGRRWPAWVYGEGSEPDARFTFANERTFLAWIRTSLALLAAGVALDALDLAIPDKTQQILAVATVTLGLLCAVASWTRWARAERAMRLGQPLPSSWFLAVLTLGIMAVAVALLVVGV